MGLVTEDRQQPPKGAVCLHFGAQTVHTSASPASSEFPQQVLGDGLDSTVLHMCIFVFEYMCALLKGVPVLKQVLVDEQSPEIVSELGLSASFGL